MKQLKKTYFAKHGPYIFSQQKRHKMKTVFFQYILLAFKGFCMGASDVVPGVSGGTMAFILGIYEDLLRAIKSFDIHALRHLLHLRLSSFCKHVQWKFLLSILSGIICAIFSLAKILNWLLINRPVFIWSFFFGLIIGSVFTVVRQIDKWNLPVFISMISGTAAAYTIVGIMPVSTPNTPWSLFLSGAIAICAMILPGISGSFILVILGKYQYVLAAVNHRDFITLFFVASGACCGIVLFVRFLNLMFNRYHDIIVATLTGFMIGSLKKVWPWKQTCEGIKHLPRDILENIQVNVLPSSFDTEVKSALFLMMLGLLAVLTVSFLAERKKTKHIESGCTGL